jgi:hypothetical protein
MDATDAAAPAGVAELRTSDSELEQARRQIAQEQRRRESAEQERDAARQHLLSERGRSFVAHEAAVASALETAKTRLGEAKRAYAQAMAESRYEEGAELQAQIAETALEIRGLAWQQQQFDQARHQPEPADHRARFEQAIGSLPPAAQEWCRRHPEFVTDSRRNAEAQAAHFAALADGLGEWSGDYWDFVERRLGLRDSEAAEEGAGTEAPPRRAAEPARQAGTSLAAPPSRGAPTGIGEPRKRTRQPTSGEIEAAKISFPDEWKESPKKALELYLENQTALRRQGRL